MTRGVRAPARNQNEERARVEMIARLLGSAFRQTDSAGAPNATATLWASAVSRWPADTAAETPNLPRHFTAEEVSDAVIEELSSEPDTEAERWMTARDRDRAMLARMRKRMSSARGRVVWRARDASRDRKVLALPAKTEVHPEEAARAKAAALDAVAKVREKLGLTNARPTQIDRQPQTEAEAVRRKAELRRQAEAMLGGANK